jgi:hypothetical protein
VVYRYTYQLLRLSAGDVSIVADEFEDVFLVA